MADDEGGGGGNRDILFLLFVFGVLLFAWFTTGAYKNADLRGIFLAPPAPIGSGEAYGPSSIGQGDGISFGPIVSYDGSVSDTLLDELEELGPTERSPFRGQISIERTYGVFATNPQHEYLVIRAGTGNARGVTVTGWSLRSTITGRSAEITDGVPVFIPNQADAKSVITLRPGDEAILTTGRSPVGVSFRDNMCTGYLTQFQDLTPEPSFSCPLPVEEADAAYPGYGLDNACYSFLQSISQCHITLTFPEDLGSTCRSFVENRLTYQGCVVAHRHEPDFLTNTWRVYLGRSAELWKSERDVITLLDQDGKLVDAVSF